MYLYMCNSWLDILNIDCSEANLNVEPDVIFSQKKKESEIERMMWVIFGYCITL